MIDLERSTLPAPLTPADRVDNLARLLRSAEKLERSAAAFSRSDLLRFLAAYEEGRAGSLHRRRAATAARRRGIGSAGGSSTDGDARLAAVTAARAADCSGFLSHHARHSV